MKKGAVCPFTPKSASYCIYKTSKTEIELFYYLQTVGNVNEELSVGLSFGWTRLSQASLDRRAQRLINPSPVRIGVRPTECNNIMSE